VADASFSAIELIAAVRGHVCFITRLKLDAIAPKRHSRIIGRPPKKGRKLPKLTELLRHVDNDRNARVVQRGTPPPDRGRNGDLVSIPPSQGTIWLEMSERVAREEHT
jgi:hypothetical protein